MSYQASAQPGLRAPVASSYCGRDPSNLVLAHSLRRLRGVSLSSSAGSEGLTGAYLALHCELSSIAS